MKELIKKAYEVLKNAYIPYSQFAVGAAILTKDGKIHTGCNIENASYGLCNCAERNAMFNAYCQGYRKDDIQALAVVSEKDVLVTPCGACRQVMVELLNPDTPVYIVYGKDEQNRHIVNSSVKELMPLAFEKEALDA